MSRICAMCKSEIGDGIVAMEVNENTCTNGLMNRLPQHLFQDTVFICTRCVCYAMNPCYSCRKYDLHSEIKPVSFIQKERFLGIKTNSTACGTYGFCRTCVEATYTSVHCENCNVGLIEEASLPEVARQNAQNNQLRHWFINRKNKKNKVIVNGYEVLLCDNCAANKESMHSAKKIKRHKYIPSPCRYETTYVQIEPKLAGTKSDKVLFDRFVGCEMEVEGGNGCYVNDLLDSRIGICHDGSLQSGVEIITPPASLDKLHNLITRTTLELRQNDFVVNSRCGLHIHFDMSDLKNKYGKLSNILKTYYLVEPILFSILPPSRLASKYCTPLSKFYKYEHFEVSSMEELEHNWYRHAEPFIEALDKELRRELLGELQSKYGYNYSEVFNKMSEVELRKNYYRIWRTSWKKYTNDWKNSKYNRSRYVGVNFHSFFYRGTFEVRHHSGTLNATKILRWININLGIVDYAIRRFDKKELEIFREGTLSEFKIRKFCQIMHLGKNTSNYMVSRAKAFRGDNLKDFNLEKFDEENVERRNEHDHSNF